MTPARKMIELAIGSKGGQLADYVGVNPVRFKSLIDTYIGGPARITQHLSGALTQIASVKPSLLNPHYKSLIDTLRSRHASTALKRNTIRLFQFVPIPARHHGRVIDICFGFLHDRSETIAVRVFAMTVLETVTRSRQELRRELQIMIEDEFPHAGPAFRSRGSKVLKKLATTPVIR